MTLSNAGSRTRKGERCAGENVKCQYSIVRSWNICFQNIWDQKEGGGATLETKICSWYMVRNTFINYDSEIGFSPRIFVIRFLPPGTNYYYYFFFWRPIAWSYTSLHLFHGKVWGFGFTCSVFAVTRCAEDTCGQAVFRCSVFIVASSPHSSVFTFMQ